MTYYIGFDIGGTAIKHGVVDEQGKIIEKGLFPSTPDDGELLIKHMASQVAKYQMSYPIEGIGISVPGIVRQDGYMISAGAITPFYNINLKEKCEAAFHLPVVLENDANCAAVAERWLGNAQDIENYIVVVLGTAVGCGIIINGKVYQGAHGAAGEIGWSMQGPLDYTHDLEDDSWNFTSGVILGLYNRYYQATGQKISDARLILDLVRQGDVIATKVMDQYYEDVAKGLLNLICVFDPEVLLLGGGISANQEFLGNLIDSIDKIKRHHRSINRLRNETIADVKPCLLRNDAGLIGAVYQAKKIG